MLSSKTSLAYCEFKLESKSKKKHTYANTKTLTEQMRPNGHLEFRDKTTVLWYDSMQGFGERSLGRLAKRMDLEHSTFKTFRKQGRADVHSQKWEQYLNQCCHTDHHSIINKSQSLFDTPPLVSLHFLEGTVKFEFFRVQQDVLVFLSTVCSGPLLLYLLSDMWVNC